MFSRKPILSIALLLSISCCTISNAQETTLDAGVESEASNIFTSKSLLQIVNNGGPLMIPIGLASVLLLVFVFERTISLRTGQIIPRHFVKLFLTQLKEGTLTQKVAIRICNENPSIISRIFAAASHKWGRPSVEVEQAIMDEGERVTYKLKKYLRLINGIATVTPLLGLLGTVVGMILAFDAIGASTTNSDPKLLIANGISQALLTTAAGMSVAIPALITYIYFVGRVDRLIVQIDDLGQKVVSHIASDAIALNGDADEVTENSTKQNTSNQTPNSSKTKSRSRTKKAA